MSLRTETCTHSLHPLYIWPSSIYAIQGVQSFSVEMWSFILLNKKHLVYMDTGGPPCLLAQCISQWFLWQESLSCKRANLTTLLSVRLEHRQNNSVLCSFLCIFVDDSFYQVWNGASSTCWRKSLCDFFLIILILDLCIYEIWTCDCSCSLPVLWDLLTLLMFAVWKLF